MKIPICKIYHSELSGTSYGPLTEITGFSDVKIRLSSENSKDVFSFKLYNRRSVDGTQNFSKFRGVLVKDYIEIYGYYLDEFTGTLSDYLLIAGYIDASTYSTTRSGAYYNVSGTNASDTLMNSYAAATFSGTSKDTVPNMIISLVARANALAGTVASKRIIAELAVLDENGDRVSGGYIWPTRTTGEGFPLVTYLKNYTNLYEHLKSISSTEYTADNVGYVYYLDKDNNLHFEPKRKGISYQIYESDTNSLKIGTTTDDMVNTILLNCGKDMKGHGILQRDYNSESIDEYGAKWKYQTITKISDGIKNTEKNLPISDNDGNYINDDGYPNAYPWYVSQSGESDGVIYYVGKQLDSDTEYESYIRAVIKTQGKKEAKRIVTDNGFPYDKVDIELANGSSEYFINDIFITTSDSSSYEKYLRIKEINHSFSDSWTTSITLVEDLETTGELNLSEVSL